MIVLIFVLASIQNVDSNVCDLGTQFPGADNYPQIEIGLVGTGGLIIDGFETPITARNALAVGAIQWDCMATYDDVIVSLYDREKRPTLSDVIPSALHTSDNRLACYAYGFSVLVEYLAGLYSTDLDFFMTVQWGLKSSNDIDQIKNEILQQCDIDDESCLDSIASQYNYCPDVMGVIVALSTINYLRNDGYNSEGNKTPFGDCTANCRPFSDPIGFFDDRVDIKKDTDIDKKLLPGFEPNNKFPWINLLEDDNKGFFYRQEHVTPHIGFTVDPITMTRNEFESLSDLIDEPDYDYAEEAELVIQRLADTANNVTKKAIIETLDNKIAVASSIQISHWAFFNPTYEENIIFEAGNRLAEYEAVLISWRQKMRFNLIRPTTIIQSGKYTEDEITTYGGPKQGVQTIKTQDFQPYIRVMPHSEYISGSGCICRMFMDQVNEYMINEYGAPSLPVFFRFYPPFSPSKYEPGIGIEDVSFVHSNMKEVYENCRQSRLWGGMHFTASIEASDEICKDVGADIYHYVQSLLNGNNDRRRRMNQDGAYNQERSPIEADELFNEYWNLYKEDEQLLEDHQNEQRFVMMEDKDGKRNVLLIGVGIGISSMIILFLFVVFIRFIVRKYKLNQMHDENMTAQNIEMDQSEKTKTENKHDKSVETEKNAEILQV